MSVDLQTLVEDDFCYLTTIGRISGRSHTIEIWFALHEETLYVLSGGRDKSDWVKNMQHQPDVQVKIRDHTFAGKGRIVQNLNEDALARRIVLDKYTPRDSDDLQDWSRTSLPVAIDLIV
jgi:deazaflavin-dependent oxidoreductase (nitroreductase family)